MFKSKEKVIILFDDGTSLKTFDDSMLDTQRGKVFADKIKNGDIINNKTVRGFAYTNCEGGDKWGQWGTDEECKKCPWGQECWQDTEVIVRTETERILNKSW